MPVVTSPTELPWVLVPDCICPIVDNQCYRPGPYSKPLICAHNHIKNISEHLSAVSVSPNGINSTIEKLGHDIGSCSTLLLILQLFTLFILISFFLCYIVKIVFFRSYVVNRKWGVQRRAEPVQLIDLRPGTSTQLTASVPSGATPSMAVRCPTTTDEYERHQILEFCSGGAKQYGLKLVRNGAETTDLEYVLKVRGMTLNFDVMVNQGLHYETFKEQVVEYATTGDYEPIIVTYPNFIRPNIREGGRVISAPMQKCYRPYVGKGIVGPNFNVLNFGHTL